jgi:Family of unknown function (DUF5670)
MLHPSQLRLGCSMPAAKDKPTRNLTQEEVMLGTIAVIFLVLWALGLVSSYTMGGFIHILLVAAVVLVLVNVIQGRRLMR